MSSRENFVSLLRSIWKCLDFSRKHNWLRLLWRDENSSLGVSGKIIRTLIAVHAANWKSVRRLGTVELISDKRHRDVSHGKRWATRALATLLRDKSVGINIVLSTNASRSLERFPETRRARERSMNCFYSSASGKGKTNLVNGLSRLLKPEERIECVKRCKSLTMLMSLDVI